MRMFAGPNGSGKTTVQKIIVGQFGPDFLGVVVNPDDLEETISHNGRLPLGPFRISDRSLSMARDAVRHTNRAYFFDTSGDAPLLVAEITDGKRLELRCEQIPNWFKTHVWDKF